LPTLPRVSTAGPAGPFEPACATFRRSLRQRGLKFTPERATILDAAMRREGLFSAEQLVDDLRAAGRRASRATVYRTLTHLRDAGLLKQVLLDPRQAYFEVIAGGPANDHLICVRTGQVVPFRSERLDAVLADICREHGFAAVSHQVLVYGLSPTAGPAESRRDT